MPLYAIGDSPGAAAGMAAGNYWNSVSAARADAEAAARAQAAAQTQRNEATRLMWESFYRNRDYAQNQDQNRFTNARVTSQDLLAQQQRATENALARDRFGLEQQKAQDESATQFRERDLALKNAMADATQGLFTDLAAVAATYPTLTPQEHATVFRQSLETRRKLAEQDAEAANIAGTLNAPSRFSKMLPEILAGKVSAGVTPNSWARGANETLRFLGGPFVDAYNPSAQVSAEVAPLLADITGAKAKERFPELGPLYAQQAEAVTRAGELRNKMGQPTDLARWNAQLGQYVPTQRLLPPSVGPVPRPFDTTQRSAAMPNEVMRVMANGKVAIFDGATKLFLRYAE